MNKTGETTHAALTGAEGLGIKFLNDNHHCLYHFCFFNSCGYIKQLRFMFAGQQSDLSRTFKAFETCVCIECKARLSVFTSACRCYRYTVYMHC